MARIHLSGPLLLPPLLLLLHPTLLLLAPVPASGQDVVPKTFADTTTYGVVGTGAMGHDDGLIACSRIASRFVSAATGYIDSLSLSFARDTLDTAGFPFNVTLLDDAAGGPGPQLPGSEPYSGDSSSYVRGAAPALYPLAVPQGSGWNVTAGQAYWVLAQPLAAATGSFLTLDYVDPAPAGPGSGLAAERDLSATGLGCPWDAAYTAPGPVLQTQTLSLRLTGFGPPLPSPSATASASASASPSASVTSSATPSASASATASATPIPSVTPTPSPSGRPAPEPDTRGQTLSIVLSVCLTGIFFGGVYYCCRQRNAATRGGSSLGASFGKGMTPAQISAQVGAPPVQTLDDDDDPDLRERFRQFKRGDSGRAARVSRASGGPVLNGYSTAPTPQASAGLTAVARPASVTAYLPSHSAAPPLPPRRTSSASNRMMMVADDWGGASV